VIDVGTHLGRYEIRAKIGAGGMGEVYRARDEKLNRDVAIKGLPASLSQDQDRLRRFEQEAQAAGALNHPNILAVYDVGTHDGSPYIVSELLEGETLRERLGGTAQPERKAIDYAIQISHGLAAAHEKGIVHRDLKRVIDRSTLGKRRPSHSLAQGLALEQLRDNIRRTIMRADIMHDQNVRMIECARCAGFLFKAMQTTGVGGKG